ncbi:MAG: hypothetical protein F6J98_48145, partial [Moorea sp. SIO4G2]|nr:hypothetical protein [Moorena sp. SIO4G2]
NILNDNSRVNIEYYQKFNGKKLEEMHIGTWAKSKHIEHMYVNYNNQIYYGLNRVIGDEHWPHPTLIGGDPEVVDAGLLRVIEENEGDNQEWIRMNDDVNFSLQKVDIKDYKVFVTNESEHFQPTGVENQTLELIELGLKQDPTWKDRKRVTVEKNVQQF